MLAVAFSILLAEPFAQLSAKPEDVKSVDSIRSAVYDVISGPAGKKRDWDRMRSLFIKDARLIAVDRKQSRESRLQSLTVQDYIRLSSPYLEQKGFFERETARKVEQFGNIAHVFSTYESRFAQSDAKPFERGINSFQLWNDGKRWWVVTIYWQAEDPRTRLPGKYLGG